MTTASDSSFPLDDGTWRAYVQACLLEDNVPLLEAIAASR
jgi:hypothetical protein